MKRLAAGHPTRLTEDLDLSYRAQLAGWRSQFLPEVEVPGEIPPQLAAYKQQQARWATGSTQCLLKLARPIVSSRLKCLSQKIMAIQHLCQYLPQPLMLLMLLLTPPLLLAGGLGGPVAGAARHHRFGAPADVPGRSDAALRQALRR